MDRDVRDEPQRKPEAAPVAPQASARGTAQAGALRLQQSAGNRAVLRMLSRWAAHPDTAEKGQFMTDQMAADWNRFNPPLSK